MDNRNPVILAGMNIPFFDLVFFLVKLAVAAVPAIMILLFFGLLFFGFSILLMGVR